MNRFARTTALGGGFATVIAASTLAAHAVGSSPSPVPGSGPAPQVVVSALVSAGLVPAPPTGPSLMQLQTLCRPPVGMPPGHMAKGDCEGNEVTLQGLCDHGLTAVCGVPEIDIIVNGAHVVSIGLANELLTAARLLHQPPTAPHTMQAAAALAILNEILYQEGKRTNPASRAEAQQLAQQAYQEYLSSPNTEILPSGETAAQYFSDPRTIKAYEFALTESRQRVLVLGNSSPADDHTPIYAQFLATALPSYKVGISGLPSFDIPSALPDGL